MKKKVYSYLLILSLLLNVFLIGVFFNLLTVANNGGKMPVYDTRVPINSNTHFSFNIPSQADYFFLSDVFHLNNYFFSIGDAIMIISYIFILFYSYKLYVLSKKLKRLRRED